MAKAEWRLSAVLRGGGCGLDGEDGGGVTDGNEEAVRVHVAPDALLLEIGQLFFRHIMEMALANLYNFIGR